MTSPPRWSSAGRILLDGSSVYYVPDAACLPPLRWQADQQQFVFLRSSSDDDVALRASLAHLAENSTPLYRPPPLTAPSSSTSLSGHIPCEALYGVLPLGATSYAALLYVAEREHVGALSLGGSVHDIFAARGLRWLLLPKAPSPQSKRGAGRQQRCHRRSSCRTRSLDGEDDTAAMESASDELPRPSNDDSTTTRTPGDAQEENSDDDDEVTGSAEEEWAEDDEADGMGRLPKKTLNDYLGVLSEFCASINTEDGGRHACAAADEANTLKGGPHRTSEMPGIPASPGQFSYLYYSTTLDLSADPLHLLAMVTDSVPDLPGERAGAVDLSSGSATADGSLSFNSTRESNGLASRAPAGQTPPSRTPRLSASGFLANERHAAVFNRHLYQWNSPLLSGGFTVPTMAILREENGLSRDRTEPWSGVCVDELWREGLAYAQHRGNTSFLSHAFDTVLSTAACSSLPLYVPSFIRGLVAPMEASPSVQLTLVTRVCCRWAGTRYNRRGLEPGHSGVVANMGVSSLWVTPRIGAVSRGNREAASSEAGKEPFAVYSVLRGSVPRRWEQPANLALKPPIKISPLSNALEEFSRHVRLLTHCMPQIRSLYCLDTLSTKPLEAPLSEAFAAAVRRYAEDMASAKNGRSVNVRTPSNAETSASGVEEKEGALTPPAPRTVAVVGVTPAVGGPSVALVHYNVQKMLKTLSYEEMQWSCCAQLDEMAGRDAWLDCTKGYARASCIVEETTETLPISTDGRSCAGGEGETVGKEARPRLVLTSVQSKFVRVNCLDCLDRTNLVQSMLCATTLPQMLDFVAGAVTPKKRDASFEAEEKETINGDQMAYGVRQLRVLFAAQGTAISQLYAGTNPHYLSYMLNGRWHWFDNISGGALALRRWYLQNFWDGIKQDGAALITRQHDPQMFNADIESPFTRDLSSMNNQVLYGVLLAVMALCYSLVTCLTESSYKSFGFQLHLGISVCWGIYLFALSSKLMRYRVTYTNRPLLLYTRQAELF